VGLKKLLKIFLTSFLRTQLLNLNILNQNVIGHSLACSDFFPGTLVSTELMDYHALKSVNNCLNTNIYSYLETSGGKSSNTYLNVVHFFNTSVN